MLTVSESGLGACPGLARFEDVVAAGGAGLARGLLMSRVEYTELELNVCLGASVCAGAQRRMTSFMHETYRQCQYVLACDRQVTFIALRYTS